MTQNSKMLNSEYIKSTVYDAGFDLCGITRCQHLKESEKRFHTWLENGYNSNLQYLTRNLDKRFDARKLVEGSHTVVVCAVNYKNHASVGYGKNFNTKIASYACSIDYHVTIKGMLKSVLDKLSSQFPELRGRMFVDTAPILEKQLAVEAGLGWIGRQSLLVTPRFGSYILLGELVINEEVDHYDQPFEGNRCGRCNNCIDSCPTDAIVAPKIIDANRCISCHTVESENQHKIALDGWIFGCDSCQSCCPYNHQAPFYTNPAFNTIFDPFKITEQQWKSMTKDEFKSRFENTALNRSGSDRIRGNIKSLE